MKYVTPRADYPVRVRRREIEEPETIAALYAGVFDVQLNNSVGIVFVPDVSAVGPPFDKDALPADLEEITTPEQARLIAVLSSRYAVTPNGQRAGTTDTFDGLVGEGGMVCYVAPSAYARYTAELDELSDRLSAFYPPGTVADIRELAVVQFWERAIIDAPGFRPEDAAILGRD
jgi:hypothetical protein